MTETTTVDAEAQRLATAEANLVAKYGSKIVVGSIARGTGSHEGKLTVEINTVGLDGQPDGQTRRVATSDVFQVHHTEAVSDQMKAQRRRDRAAQRRAAQPKAPKAEKAKVEAKPKRKGKAKAEASA